MKDKNILLIIISSFVLIVVWISFTIYHNSASSTISPTVGLQIKPITASFDIGTINALKRRNKIEPLYQIEVPISPTPSPSSPDLLNESVSSSSGNQESINQIEINNP